MVSKHLNKTYFSMCTNEIEIILDGKKTSTQLQTICDVIYQNESNVGIF